MISFFHFGQPYLKDMYEFTCLFLDRGSFGNAIFRDLAIFSDFYAKFLANFDHFLYIYSISCEAELKTTTGKNFHPKYSRNRESFYP